MQLRRTNQDGMSWNALASMRWAGHARHLIHLIPPPVCCGRIAKPARRPKHSADSSMLYVNAFMSEPERINVLAVQATKGE